MHEEILNIKNQAIAQIGEVKNAEELEAIRIDYFGRNGKLSTLIKKLKNLGDEERRSIGRLVNETKNTVENLIETQKYKFKSNIRVWFDPTVPVEPNKIGHLHPTSIVINEMVDIFSYLGFSQIEGPEIETDRYNFELLNLPKDHPARSLQDVLYIEEQEILLRSHTSSVETKSLENLKLPY